MNVLVLTPYVAWPLDHGGRIRSYHLLRALARRHRIVNVAVARSPKERDDAHELERIGISVRPGLVPRPDLTLPARRLAKWFRIAAGRSSLPGRWWHPAHAEMIRDTARQTRFDLVLVDGLWMDVYRRDLAPERYVASTHNVESDILLDAARLETGLGRLVATRDARLLRRRESDFVAGAAATIAVSDDDAVRLRALAPSSAVTVVENGAEVDAIRPLPPADPRGPVLFVGSFDYGANVDAARFLVGELLPIARARMPGLAVVLAGRNPPPEIRALARDGVEVAGSVADLGPLYARAGAVVVPLRIGGGTRIKILEALAHGRPVVTTAAGMRGLAVKPETHVLVAETPDQFAEALARLRNDPGLGARLAAAGRAWVEERHAWSALEDRFAGVIDRLERAPS